MTPRSLLDGVNLSAVRSAAARLEGPGAGVVACLVASGVFQHDPTDPGWPDRDRLVVGATALQPICSAALPEAVWENTSIDEALGEAVELARASAAVGAPYRVFCVLDEGVYAQGPSWEAAVAAGSERLATLTALVVGADPRHVDRMMRAAGWKTWWAGSDDPVQILAALDHAFATPAAPTAVLLSAETPSGRSLRPVAPVPFPGRGDDL